MTHWLQIVYWQHLGYMAEMALKFPYNFGNNGKFWKWFKKK